MAEPKTQEPAKSKPRSLGRRIATAIYWLLAFYIVGVGVYSIVPQVFYPPSVAPPEGTTCSEGLRSLHGELMAMAGDRVAAGSAHPASQARWMTDFDRRHAGLEARCTGQGHDAWVLLGRLRQRVASTLGRYDAEEGALAREMDDTLAQLAEAQQAEL